MCHLIISKDSFQEDITPSIVCIAFFQIWQKAHSGSTLSKFSDLFSREGAKGLTRVEIYFNLFPGLSFKNGDEKKNHSCVAGHDGNGYFVHSFPSGWKGGHILPIEMPFL